MRGWQKPVVLLVGAALAVALFVALLRAEAQRVQIVITTQPDSNRERMYYRRQIPGVKFLVAGGSSRESTRSGSMEYDVVSIETANEYPPFRLNWLGWQKLDTNAKWVVRCDSDALIDSRALETALETLPTNVPVYAGKPGHGRLIERQRLEIGNWSRKIDGVGFNEFAVGGCCEAMNALAHSIFVKNAHVCYAESSKLASFGMDLHHDVEIGRCFWLLGIPLTTMPWSCVQKFPSKTAGTQQTGSITPSEIFDYSGTVVHPVKNWLARTMYHNRQLFEPPQSLGCAVSVVGTLFATACNKWGKPDLCSHLETDRCILDYEGAEELSETPMEAEIISLGLPEQPPPPVLGYPFRSNVLEAVDNRKGWRTPELTAGEVGYILSYTKALDKHIARKSRVFAIFDEDAIPRTPLQMLDKECIAPLVNGGFVLLGWINWNDWAWDYLLGDKPGKLCVDVTPKTLGSFATVLTLETAVLVRNWITATNFTRPLDHVWGDLVQLNVPGTAAFPHSFTMNVSKPSTIDPNRTQNELLRVKRSRWDWRADN